MTKQDKLIKLENDLLNYKKQVQTKEIINAIKMLEKRINNLKGIKKEKYEEEYESDILSEEEIEKGLCNFNGESVYYMTDKRKKYIRWYLKIKPLRIKCRKLWNKFYEEKDLENNSYPEFHNISDKFHQIHRDYSDALEKDINATPPTIAEVKAIIIELEDYVNRTILKGGE